MFLGGELSPMKNATIFDGRSKLVRPFVATPCSLRSRAPPRTMSNTKRKNREKNSCFRIDAIIVRLVFIFQPSFFWCCFTFMENEDDLN